jgi:hypothetical protein
MTKVFIGGSRRLSSLSAEVKRRIDTVISKGFTIVVGDANGADKAVQRHLAAKGYRSVIVFCMTGDCRNNIGGWPTRGIAATEVTRRDFAYFSTKDRVMVDDASHGLMLWDGRSKGTLNNVVNLARQRKPVVVYFAPTKSFHTVRAPADVGELLAKCDRSCDGSTVRT